MRAYLEVKSGSATLHIPSTGNQVEMAVDVTRLYRDKEPGWYRASARVLAQQWWCTPGRRVDPAVEAERLDRMATAVNERGPARTSMPGVAGYQRMANMSSASADTQYLINRHFAELLRKATS